jgi:molybdopterin converting factor small subunit
MASVAFARHLYRFFPSLEGKDVKVKAETVAEAVRELEKLCPGFAFYVVDERGSLRVHVNIFVEEELILDRVALSDRLKPDSKIYIMQALSGG